MTAASALLSWEERRSNRRYRIEMPLTWGLPKNGLQGFGTTLDMSSHGLSFSGGNIPQKYCGAAIHLRLDWPALLDGTTPMLLALSGTIVRMDATACAIVFKRPVEFKTRTLQAKKACS